MAPLAAGDTTADAPTSPRNILRAFYVAPGNLPLDPALEDVFVTSMLTTRTGEDHYLGDAKPSDAWARCGAGWARRPQHDVPDRDGPVRHH